MISKSPFNEQHEFEVDLDEERAKIDAFTNNDRSTVVIQGLGFVGAAMVAALSRVEADGQRLYNVIGVDLPDENNYWKIGRVNSGKAPVMSSDKAIDRAYQDGKSGANILATYSPHAYTKANVVVIDINLDITKKALGNPYESQFTYDNYISAIETIAGNITEDTLVIVESTVPPGTTEKILFPIFKEHFKQRDMDISKLYLAHSYERVMPGKDYLKSITDFYRVYSAVNDVSKDKARAFLESFINTKDFPLSEMHSTTASETSKVLENSFRALNIAFMQEWTAYAERMNVNLFEVIDAIRVRPTHRNIMSPGFGVGGYCLTKDSLLADWSLTNLYDSDEHLDMSLSAVAINDLMPDYTLELIKNKCGDLTGMNITVLGISYLSDVADTRYSPTEYFCELCEAEGANITLHDSIVEYWQERDIHIDTDMTSLMNGSHDVAVFTVRHTQYLELDSEQIIKLLPGVKLVIDANNIVGDGVANGLRSAGIDVLGVGKGHWQ